jgi:uncharacterized protein
MALNFDHSFTVNAPVERVWAYLTDPYKVAAALPGAAITEKIDDQNYGGTLTVKVGPVAAKYKGAIRFEALDKEKGRAELSGRGQDTGGRGGADMKMTSQITEQEGGQTQIQFHSTVNVTGMMAQFGRGLIADVSNQMFSRFSEALKSQLEESVEPPGAGEPASRAAQSGDVGTTLGASAAAPVAAPARDVAPPEGVAAASRTPTSESGNGQQREEASEESSKSPAPASHAPPIDVLSTMTGGLASRVVRRPVFWFVVVLLGWLFYRCQ